MSTLPPDFSTRRRSEQIKLMTDAMRALAPKRFDAARSSVRRNIKAMQRHQPQLANGRSGGTR